MSVVEEIYDPMSPDASPGVLGQRSGVRRVNNLPIYIIATAVAVFLIIMMLVAMDRASRQQVRQKESKNKTDNTSLFAQEIAGNYRDGLIAPEMPPVPPGMPNESMELVVPIARPADLDNPPLPPIRDPVSAAKPDDDLQRLRAKKRELFEAAVTAKTTVPVTDLRSRSAMGGMTASADHNSRDARLQRLAEIHQRIESIRSENPTSAYQARLAQLQGFGSVGGGAEPATAPQLVQSSPKTGSRHEIDQFAGDVHSDRWRLDSRPEAPRTSYELRAGFVVPATMISGINSGLPGQIMAQVSQHVYDTATGKYLLIPQGSRLVGAYSSEVAYGQERVLIAWQRIVFPDGKAMDIGAMPGADGSGYAGFADQVNHHYGRIFGSAFMMSLITAGIGLTQDNDNNDGNRLRAQDALSFALGQQLGATTAQMITKNLNIAPTIEIRPGFRFNVMVSKDMTFSKPYHAFDY